MNNIDSQVLKTCLMSAIFIVSVCMVARMVRSEKGMGWWVIVTTLYVLAIAGAGLWAAHAQIDWFLQRNLFSGYYLDAADLWIPGGTWCVALASAGVRLKHALPVVVVSLILIALLSLPTRIH